LRINDLIPEANRQYGLVTSEPALPVCGYTYTGALFSSDARYRYLLLKLWSHPEAGRKLRLCHFLMLNPSTADAFRNDPTVERCERRARGWHFDGLLVSNLFAIRATDPVHMMQDVAPVGLFNTQMIVAAADAAAITICAWGTLGAHMGRDAEVLDALAARELHALKLTKGGAPAHPLYLANHLQPFRFRPRGER
jgi:hypothetical protein